MKISRHACDALRVALAQGVAGVRIAEKLGVSPMTVWRHRDGQCHHLAEKWTYSPAAQFDAKAATQWLLEYNEVQNHSGADRVKAHRLREQLRRYVAVGGRIPAP